MLMFTCGSAFAGVSYVPEQYRLFDGWLKLSVFTRVLHSTSIHFTRACAHTCDDSIPLLN